MAPVPTMKVRCISPFFYRPVDHKPGDPLKACASGEIVEVDHWTGVDVISARKAEGVPQEAPKQAVEPTPEPAAPEDKHTARRGKG